MCCYDSEHTHAIDCDTGEPFFQTKINEYDEKINILPSYPIGLTAQALVSFVPTGQASINKVKSDVANTLTWNAPATYQGDITSMIVWLDEVSIDGYGDTLAFTDAWKLAEKGLSTSGNLTDCEPGCRVVD